MEISKNTTIEELLQVYPGANEFFFNLGFRCLRCGEPFWGSIEEFLEAERFKGDIDALVTELKDYIRNEFRN